MLQAVSDIAVHIGHFRNVDLFHQGLYHIQCRVFQNHDGEEVDAIPHLLPTSEGQPSLPPSIAPDGSALETSLPAAVIESEMAFRTKTFPIQYSEEELEVNDIGIFRVEQDIRSTVPVMLELKLMRAVVAPGKDQPPLPKVDEAEFHNISTLRVRLYDTSTGMHAYSSIIFDELHFCEIGLMVHACLVDFRLRRRPDEAIMTSRGDGSSKGHPKPLEQSLLDMAYEVSILDPEERRSSRSSETSADSAGEVSPLAVALDRVQRSYIRRLSNSRKDLVAFLEETSANDGQETLRRSLNNLAPFIHPNERKLPSGEVSSLPSKRVDAEDLDAPLAVRLLVEDFFFASAQVTEVWLLLMNSLVPNMHVYSKMLRKSWMQSTSQYWKYYIDRKICPESELLVPSDQEIWRTHAGIAETRRTKSSKAPRVHCIEDLSQQMDQAEHPVIFEQRYSKDDITSKEYKGVHLIVLAHGLQGNPFDMRLIKNNIALLFPKALFLCSSVNEYHTEHDIECLGKRFAHEVLDHIRDWCPCPEANHRSQSDENAEAVGDQDLCLGRLSFVTYSIGGLIVRSALPELVVLQKYMYTFMSLSSMHLGFLAGKYSLTKTLLWLGKKWREGKVYEQLLLQDAPNIEDSFIARLAHKPGLDYFQHVALVGSYQDLYAPFESARVEMSGGIEKEQCSQLWKKLCTEILRDVKPERVVRFDVNFHIPETNLDTMIGRAAHIQFIECQPVMRMFIHTYGYLFE